MSPWYRRLAILLVAVWPAKNVVSGDGGQTTFVESLLQVNVDVVTERGLRPKIRERVQSEALPL